MRRAASKKSLFFRREDVLRNGWMGMNNSKVQKKKNVASFLSGWLAGGAAASSTMRVVDRAKGEKKPLGEKGRTMKDVVY